MHSIFVYTDIYYNYYIVSSGFAWQDLPGAVCWRSWRTRNDSVLHSIASKPKAFYFFNLRPALVMQLNVANLNCWFWKDVIASFLSPPESLLGKKTVEDEFHWEVKTSAGRQSGEIKRQSKWEQQTNQLAPVAARKAVENSLKSSKKIPRNVSILKTFIQNLHSKF